MQGFIIHACLFRMQHGLIFQRFGKKTLWDVWRSSPNLTALFTHLSQAPKEVSDGDMEEIELFVVLLYSCTSYIVTVNAARKKLFCYGNQSWKTFLLQEQHFCNQAGHIWGQALIAKQFLPSPSD